MITIGSWTHNVSCTSRRYIRLVYVKQYLCSTNINKWHNELRSYLVITWLITRTLCTIYTITCTLYSTLYKVLSGVRNLGFCNFKRPLGNSMRVCYSWKNVRHWSMNFDILIIFRRHETDFCLNLLKFPFFDKRP